MSDGNTSGHAAAAVPEPSGVPPAPGRFVRLCRRLCLWAWRRGYGDDYLSAIIGTTDVHQTMDEIARLGMLHAMQSLHPHASKGNPLAPAGARPSHREPSDVLRVQQPGNGDPRDAFQDLSRLRHPGFVDARDVNGGMGPRQAPAAFEPVPSPEQMRMEEPYAGRFGHARPPNILSTDHPAVFAPTHTEVK